MNESAPWSKYILTYTHTHCVYIYTYIPTHLRTYIHTYKYINTYIHTYVRTYVHIHIHTYIHTYTQRDTLRFSVSKTDKWPISKHKLISNHHKAFKIFTNQIPYDSLE